MNKQVPFKIALIGCGRVADKHLKAINYLAKNNRKHGKRVELSALVDPYTEARSRVLGQYKFSNRVYQFKTIDDLFNSDNKADIVAITTPSSQHYLQAKLSLENDCHVFIEKPMTLQLKHAQEIQNLALSKNKKIVLGHIFRYYPLVGLVIEDIAKGYFGKPLYGNICVRWGHDQAYYDQAAWRGTREHDGGVIMNQSIHALDLMHWFLGEPALVAAKGSISTQIHQMEAEDLGFGIFEFEDDRWLAVEGTTNTDPKRPEASFFLRCSKGEIRAGTLAGKLSFSTIDQSNRQLRGKYLREEIKQRIKKEGYSFLFQMANPHTGIYLDLIESILHDKQTLANGESGIKSLEMVLALYKDAGVDV